MADLLLLPSLHESFGLVALEAMACGVVPVATSRGGAGEFIQDGVNGFLRDPEDIDGMAAAVLAVLQDDGSAPADGRGRPPGRRRRFRRFLRGQAVSRPLRPACWPETDRFHRWLTGDRIALKMEGDTSVDELIILGRGP